MTLMRRSLVTALVVSAMAAVGGASPASADLAGGGNYAASVATKTVGNGFQTGKNAVQLRGRTSSTSNVVSHLHGKMTLSMYRAQTGGLVARRQLTVDGASGITYSISVTIPSTIPRGSRSTYYVVATFSPTAGHIEKTSVGSAGFFHLY